MIRFLRDHSAIPSGGDRVAKILAERRGRKRHKDDGEQRNELSQSITRERALPIQATIENEMPDDDGKYSIAEGFQSIFDTDALSYCGAAEYAPW